MCVIWRHRFCRCFRLIYIHTLPTQPSPFCILSLTNEGKGCVTSSLVQYLIPLHPFGVLGTRCFKLMARLFALEGSFPVFKRKTFPHRRPSLLLAEHPPVHPVPPAPLPCSPSSRLPAAPLLLFDLSFSEHHRSRHVRSRVPTYLHGVRRCNHLSRAVRNAPGRGTLSCACYVHV